MLVFISRLIFCCGPPSCPAYMYICNVNRNEKPRIIASTEENAMFSFVQCMNLEDVSVAFSLWKTSQFKISQIIHWLQWRIHPFPFIIVVIMINTCFFRNRLIFVLVIQIKNPQYRSIFHFLFFIYLCIFELTSDWLLGLPLPTLSFAELTDRPLNRWWMRMKYWMAWFK